ncbi:SMC-Scp complex subunit ScpB [Biformimicrobium ophioploci]|uniref:SMC-Scp complex subunit ScpB n=1 Tax=Biformimicrobium ophioploci TaxID=3036711 RepID=A0ABQ6LZL8_9GAMM|nr:SMC-Scp complex subunit ScpB [Microbulbifer sp. NKW57]GMG87487.1 hypothetical protein MNKW57_18080 [Microbulbifer sp. NKW57]
MSISNELLRRIVEGALLASSGPLSEDRLLDLIEEGERPEKSVLREVLAEIEQSCGDRGFELKQVASGWRFQVPADLAPWVNRLWEEKPQKYSRAVLETLAIIAYRQPITRGDIEEIRGVAVSSHIVKTLSERDWIKVVGHRDVPGKPALFATTRAFLDYFNLKSLDDLPTLSEIRDIDSLNQALDLGEGMAGVAAQETAEEVAEERAEETAEETAEEAQIATEGEAAADEVSEDAALHDEAAAEETERMLAELQAGSQEIPVTTIEREVPEQAPQQPEPELEAGSQPAEEPEAQDQEPAALESADFEDDAGAKPEADTI